MSYRMYNYKKKIEELEGGYFNYKAPQVEHILLKECPGMLIMNSDLGEVEEWEIPTEHIKKLVKKLKEEDQDKFMDELYDVTDFDYSVGDFVKILDKILKTSSMKDNYTYSDFIYLRWI